MLGFASAKQFNIQFKAIDVRWKLFDTDDVFFLSAYEETSRIYGCTLQEKGNIIIHVASLSKSG